MSFEPLKSVHSAGTSITVTNHEGWRHPDREAIAPTVHGCEAWKRCIDIVASIGALIVLAPLISIIAVLVKLSSRGPTLFSQERVGIDRRVQTRRAADRGPVPTERRSCDRRQGVKYGKPFRMYKFRTMVDNAEPGKPVWASKEDPRVTPIGRFLRRTHMDEIPQFVNVLRGDMSLVGPRPERAFFIDEASAEIPDFRLRLRAKPGITGLAQINIGYTNSVPGMSEKLHYDLEYISRLGVRSDLKIIMETVRVVLSGKGAT